MPMSVPRSQMGVAILDNYLYVVGGTNKQHEDLNSVEKYSFSKVNNRCWSRENSIASTGIQSSIYLCRTNGTKFRRCRWGGRVQR